MPMAILFAKWTGSVFRFHVCTYKSTKFLLPGRVGTNFVFSEGFLTYNNIT